MLGRHCSKREKKRHCLKNYTRYILFKSKQLLSIRTLKEITRYHNLKKNKKGKKGKWEQEKINRKVNSMISSTNEKGCYRLQPNEFFTAFYIFFIFCEFQSICIG